MSAAARKNDIQCVSSGQSGGESVSANAAERLTKAVRAALFGTQTETEDLKALLWACVTVFEEIPLATLTGLDFTYTIKKTRQGEKGNQLCVSRKEKTISRSSIEVAFDTVLARAREQKTLPVVMNGPKQLGTFGASYMYPLFIRLGLIVHVAQGRKRKRKNGETPAKPAASQRENCAEKACAQEGEADRRRKEGTRGGHAGIV